MARVVKRNYRSPTRAAGAAATRAAIRAAASELFLEAGYAATTMKAVAARAGVGERTLYDSFASKTALFEHVVGVAIAGDEDPVPVAERPEFHEALTESDPHRAVALYAGYATALLERAGPLITVAIESAGADPALRRFSDEGAAATRANTTTFVQALADRGMTRGDTDDLAMAAYALTTPLVHRNLRRDLGWSANRYRRWLEAGLGRQLLGVAGP